jgi:hypothetical protein
LKKNKYKIIGAVLSVSVTLIVYFITHSCSEFLDEYVFLIILCIMELFFIFVPRWGGLIESIDFINHIDDKEDEIDKIFDKALSKKNHDFDLPRSDLDKKDTNE